VLLCGSLYRERVVFYSALNGVKSPLSTHSLSSPRPLLMAASPQQLTSPISSSSALSPSSHGKQSLYQIAFTQRQWKQKHGQHFAKLSKDEDDSSPPQQQVHQQQQRQVGSNGRKENGAYQYLTPISGANGSPGSAEDEEDADTETGSNCSLPIDLNDDSPIVVVAPEKRPITSPKKETTPLSFVPKKAKLAVSATDGIAEPTETLPPPPQLVGGDRQGLHAELIREIRNGRDTPGRSSSFPPPRHHRAIPRRGQQSARAAHLLTERAQDIQLA
jgi:hypothetical protein